MKEMDRYRMDIIGISEAGWTGSEMMKERSGHTVIHSGREDKQHRKCSNHHVRQSSKDIDGMESTGGKTRFNSKYTKLTVTPCYAPIEDVEEAKKDVFYDRLQQAIQDVSSHDVLCVIVVPNASVGNDNEGRDKIMGKNGCGNMNDNGGRLCDLCVENSLAIGGTLFQQREIHKMTWTSPRWQHKHTYEGLNGV